MKFTCDFDSLVANLSDLAEVVEDGLISEDMRNVIFRFTKETVELIGVNQLITFIRPLDHQYFTIQSEDSDFSEEGIRYMQLSSKELSNFLNSYKGVRRTSIEEVSFTTQPSNRVKCSVLEKDLENGNEHVSSWTFIDIPMKRNVLGLINIPKPEKELEQVETRMIMFYTKNLLPLLQTGTTLYSRLTFAEDYVIAFTSTHITFMNNLLSESFKGVLLTHRAISFMNKVICNISAETVGVSRDAQYLYFEAENTKAFIRYENKLPQYDHHLKMFTKENAFALDRIYLKDSLKRLKLLNEGIEFTVDAEKSEIILKNTKFIQGIDLLQTKNLDACGQIRFKVLPDVLSNVIIGSDDEFSPTLYVYYCPQPNKTAVLVFTDDSGSWFSSITVKPY